MRKKIILLITILLLLAACFSSNMLLLFQNPASRNIAKIYLEKQLKQKYSDTVFKVKQLNYIHEMSYYLALIEDQNGTKFHVTIDRNGIHDNYVEEGLSKKIKYELSIFLEREYSSTKEVNTHVSLENPNISNIDK